MNLFMTILKLIYVVLYIFGRLRTTNRMHYRLNDLVLVLIAALLYSTDMFDGWIYTSVKYSERTTGRRLTMDVTIGRDDALANYIAEVTRSNY